MTLSQTSSECSGPRPGTDQKRTGIRTYSWCQPHFFSEEMGRSFFPHHNCFLIPETGTTQGFQSFGIGKADRGTASFLAPEDDVGRYQLTDVGRDLLCLCLHPTLSNTWSTKLEHTTVLKTLIHLVL